MGGRHILPVNRQMREGAGVQAGDAVEVVLERDDGPRTVTLPPDLGGALAARPRTRARWEALSFTRRKEHVRSLEEAKKPETRSRRLERILSDLDGSTP